jgi:hypothetical protein
MTELKKTTQITLCGLAQGAIVNSGELSVGEYKQIYWGWLGRITLIFLGKYPEFKNVEIGCKV